LEELKKEIENLDKEKADFGIQLDKLNDEQIGLKKQSEDLQVKLIREGSALSVEEITNMKIEKHQLGKKIEELKDSLRQLLDIAPFAIAGKLK